MDGSVPVTPWAVGTRNDERLQCVWAFGAQRANWETLPRDKPENNLGRLVLRSIRATPGGRPGGPELPLLFLRELEWTWVWEVSVPRPRHSSTSTGLGCSPCLPLCVGHRPSHSRLQRGRL